MHRVFVSFHNADQAYKDTFVKWATQNEVFIDGSVATGDIPEDWTDEKIREEIRDEYLRDTSVTIVLVGTQTMYRKHVDWEIYSSMYDGKLNKKSGVIVVLLPSARSEFYTAAYENERNTIYPMTTNWITINTREEYQRRYPFMPARILDNLVKNEAKISVINWDKITVDGMRMMIENAFENRTNCQYDLSRPMRRNNYSA